MGKSRTRGRKGPTFVALFHYVLDSPAYAALSCTARAALVELGRLYRGDNNGRLVASAQSIGERIGMSKMTASRALIELEEAGFIDTVKVGSFTYKQRTASEYRLTFHRCDLSHRPPSRRFLTIAHGNKNANDGNTHDTEHA